METTNPDVHTLFWDRKAIIKKLCTCRHFLSVGMFTSNGACFTPYSPTWAVFFWMYQSRYTGSIAYMVLPTQQKLTLLRRVGPAKISGQQPTQLHRSSLEYIKLVIQKCSAAHRAQRPAFGSDIPDDTSLQDIISANPKPCENCGKG